MSKHIGSSFDSFLEEEGLLSETNVEAVKRVLSWQIQEFLEKQNIKKTDFAKQIHTSRSQLDRLLDPSNTNVSLRTLVSTVQAMGKQLEIRIR
jgi:antitoxin HicB